MAATQHNPHAEMSDMNYGEIYPRGLFRLLKRLGRYNKPIYITENGLPDLDDDQPPGLTWFRRCAKCGRPSTRTCR